MTDYLDLPIGAQTPGVVTAVIEISQGCINKYEYDKNLHVFRLDRNLHSPVHYPGDYGFVPQTLAEDGDPLDILILAMRPHFRAASIMRGPLDSSKCWIKAYETRKFLRVPLGIHVLVVSRITPKCSRNPS